MVNWTRLMTRKETVSYLRPPPIPQPRVLDDEPEARVRDAGEPEEPRDHGSLPTPDRRVAARDLRSEPEQLFVGAPALEDPLLVAPGAPRAFEDPHGFCRRSKTSLKTSPVEPTPES